MKTFEVDLITPSTDPQDPGFDTFVNYVATRDPTLSEPLVYNGLPFLPLWWQNASSSDDWATYATAAMWLCVNNTADAMIWWQMVFDANILSILSAQGWKTNTNRSYSLRSSPAFGIEYMPSTTNDTQVYVSETITLTGEIQAQVNSGSGYIVVGQTIVSGIIPFIVPANSKYKIVSVSGLSNTIVSIAELTS